MNVFRIEPGTSSRPFILFFSHVLLQVKPLQRCLGTTSRKIGHVKVLRCDVDQPFSFHNRVSADVVLCGQDKLMIEHPVWLLIQNTGRMKENNLIVLGCEVMTRPLFVCNLHEEATDNCFAYVCIVMPGSKFSTAQSDIKLLTKAGELVSNIVCRFHRSVVQVVLEAPLCTLSTLLECMKDIQQCQVIPVHMGKLCLCFIGLFRLITRPHEADRNAQHGHNGEYLVAASILWTGDQHLRKLWIQRKLAHEVADFGELTLIIKSAKIIEQLQCPYHCFWCWWIQKVKVH
mmetsp:Transcript_7553/g.46424  ORF Transcript_7553/g.46424 Transcript_7553/m.46424 type:complete len:288 (-) Transcript_7553:1343-2206(-)